MHKKLGILLVLPLVAVAANGSSPEPEPGLYQVTAGVSGQDLPPGAVEESIEQCVTKEDLAADPASIVGEHAGMEGCTITRHEWGNGKISMQMECAIEGADATAESRGTYNASSYELVTTMTIKIEDMTINMESFVRAERIGDC
jgi:hypothetical protein